MGQRDGNFVLAILLPDVAGKGQLLIEFGHQHLGQRNDTVLAALGPDQKKGELIQVEVFDPQVERFANPQPAAIDQSGDEIGGITGSISNSLEQRLGLRNGRSMAETGRSFSAKRIDVFQRLMQDFVVKEQHRVKGLILGAGG